MKPSDTVFAILTSPFYAFGWMCAFLAGAMDRGHEAYRRKYEGSAAESSRTKVQGR